MNPTVSVIIPLYNGEETIQRCIESVINQSYKDFEIIMVDDGSTDQSALIADSICDEYTEKGFHLRVIHKVNGGVGSARNTGIENARGRYFVCIDCDDTVAPSYLEDFIKPMEEFKDVGHVCCGFLSKAQGDKEYVFSNQELYSEADRKDYMILLQKIMVQSPCFRLYRTDVVKKHQIRMREDISLGEDLLFNLKYFDAVKNTKFIIVNKANYIYYDLSDSSLNHKYRPDLNNIYKLLNRTIKKYLMKWDAWDSVNQEMYFNHVFTDFLNVFENTFNEKNEKNFFQKIKSNNSMLRSKAFAEALEEKTIRLPFYMEYAYHTKQYLIVIAAKKIGWLARIIFRR